MKLPDKPSELLTLALKDLEACKRDSNYSISMSVWHSFEPNDRQCYVCMAGAVMAQTMKVPLTKMIDPAYCAETRQLYAINEFRMGNIKEGLSFLDISKPFRCAGYFPVAEYCLNPEQFKQDIKGLITYLQTFDL